MHLQTIKGFLGSFFTKKRTIWTIVILIIIFGGWFFFAKKGSKSTIQTGKVVRQDIEKTVLTTGQVVSSTDLDLSFQTSGVVRQIRVKEGDTVWEGQVLAVLDQGNAMASLESAKGQYAQAKANYDKIKSAATEADIAVSKAAVESAEVSLANAKQNLLRQLSTTYNDASTAVNVNTNVLFSNPQSINPQFGIPGTVQTDSQAIALVNNDRVAVNDALINWQTKVSNVTEANADQAVSDSLSYLSIVNKYLTDILTLLTVYTSSNSSSIQTTVASYQAGVATAKSTITSGSNLISTDIQAVKSAQSSLDQAKASLALKQSPARPEDIAIAEAQVLSAQGTLHSAETALSNTVITAPANGTITSVDIKIGEQTTPQKEVLKLQNVGELHAEALVSEADIASVKVGQSIDNTFDALGPDKHFTTKVITVNPASTVVSGVVNYKVIGSLTNVAEIKPGMTVNMIISVASTTNALVVPSSAVVNKVANNTGNANDLSNITKKFVKVIDDPKKKTYHEVEVQTGLEADGGLTEIISGLTEGQEVVTYMK